MLQSKNKLENRRGVDDEMPGEVWKEMENRKTDKSKMVKVEREREKKR